MLYYDGYPLIKLDHVLGSTTNLGSSVSAKLPLGNIVIFLCEKNIFLGLTQTILDIEYPHNQWKASHQLVSLEGGGWRVKGCAM